MFEQNLYRRCFDDIRAPAAMKAEVLQMTKKRTLNLHGTRRVLVLAAVLVLLLALGGGAYAAGRTFLGWGGNAEIIQTQTDHGMEIVTVLHTDDLTEPVTFENGRMLFIVNGERIDITDQVSETQAYLYNYTDEEGTTHYWAVGKNGPEPEHYGYAEFLYREGESWLGGYAARTNNNEATWLDAAKTAIGVPW